MNKKISFYDMAESEASDTNASREINFTVSSSRMQAFNPLLVING
jgi:hypothetical protein